MSERATYHHGDLRQALIAAAVDLISAKGVAGLSVAEAARKAGVSGAAPYRHFASRTALLSAAATALATDLLEHLQMTAAGVLPVASPLLPAASPLPLPLPSPMLLIPRMSPPRSTHWRSSPARGSTSPWGVGSALNSSMRRNCEPSTTRSGGTSPAACSSSISGLP